MINGYIIAVAVAGISEDAWTIRHYEATGTQKEVVSSYVLWPGINRSVPLERAQAGRTERYQDFCKSTGFSHNFHFIIAQLRSVSVVLWLSNQWYVYSYFNL